MVGIFEDTIARFMALAVLLPVVAGQAGNSGAQTLAVAMRGLALREFRVSQWRSVALKEVGVGLLSPDPPKESVDAVGRRGNWVLF